MRNSFLYLVLIFSTTVHSQIIQKKYPGISGKPSEYLYVNGETTRLVPMHQYDSYLGSNVGIANKPANHVLLNKTDDVAVYPYLVVPEAEYESFMKSKNGYANRPANHVNINGKETILLSSRDINTNAQNYTGIASRPANHVLIDGQEFIFVQKNNYQSFLAKHRGIPGLPANYIMINDKVVIVVPINPEDVADIHSEPAPTNVNDQPKISRPVSPAPSNRDRPRIPRNVSPR